MKKNIIILILFSFLVLTITPIHARLWNQYFAIQYNYLRQKLTGNYAYTLNTTKSRIPYDQFMKSAYNQLKEYIDQTKPLAPAEKAIARNNLDQKFYKIVNSIAQNSNSEKIALNFHKYFPNFFYTRGIKVITKDFIFSELKNKFALIETDADLKRYFQDLPGISTVKK